MSYSEGTSPRRSPGAGPTLTSSRNSQKSPVACGREWALLAGRRGGCSECWGRTLEISWVFPSALARNWDLILRVLTVRWGRVKYLQVACLVRDLGDIKSSYNSVIKTQIAKMNGQRIWIEKPISSKNR